MKELLNNLFEHKTLSRNQAEALLADIASEKYAPSQVAALLSVFLMRSITVEELSGFRDAMLALSLPVDFGSQDTIDIVGTGGDGKDTFNISTLACFVVAGAGINVTKHGNYGVSSKSGSSNVLEAMGYEFTNDTDVLKRQLDTSGICFMHAPLFHPAMKSVAPVRKELGVRTFFNILGPVVNPCLPKYQMLGVYNLEMARLYTYLLQNTTAEYAIVHSLDGYDEVSLTSGFKLITNRNEQLIDPAAIGFKMLKQQDLFGGSTVAEAAKIFHNVLNREGTAAQNTVVCANAAIAIQCRFPDRAFADCFAEANDSLLSGSAMNVFRSLLTN